MKANLKRKFTIAREILAVEKDAKLSLEMLNIWKRDGREPRSFTEELTAAQVAVLKGEAQ
jgi:hypothetical protein